MTVRPRFVVSPTESFSELRLLSADKPIPTSQWPLSGHSGANICQRWIAGDEAIEDGHVLFVTHAAISRLSAAQAAKLDLPAATTLRAVVEGSGWAMTHSGFSVSLRWVQPTGQNAPGAIRTGAWLRNGTSWQRLPETVFAVAEAVAAHCAAVGNEAERLRALASLRRALPQAVLMGAEANGLLGSVTIIEADAFSLDTSGEGDAMQLVPVLHRAGAAADAAPLLAEEGQRLFGLSQFQKFQHARSVYSLPGGVYITLSPPLRQALEVVRRASRLSPAGRRAFLREPRAAIAAAIGDEAEAALVTALLVETPNWAERVIGLGLWQKRVIPWVPLPGNEWFDAGNGGPRGIMVGDRSLPLKPAEAADLANRVNSAMEAGEASVVVAAPDGPLDVPVNAETLQILKGLAKPRSRRGDTPPPGEKQAVLIETNEQNQDIEARVIGRPAASAAIPFCVTTTLKAHQEKGLAWLKDNWIAGSPGVLLADDMGLGKTLQGLAFLAWLRLGMLEGVIARRPLLIVAPTGLLQNWLAEHDRHLASPGLGEVLCAFGTGLRDLRSGNSDGRLDIKRLRAADWVLTTYETLRDQDSDFGQVAFAAMLLDEAQKVKTPGIRMTDAIKGMNADFRVAMTGTPVENRLADLWCIVDGVAPGHLNSLRYFSNRYEAAPDTVRLAELRASLDQPLGPRPPLLLRRLKEDELPDLPNLTERVTEQVMTGPQLQAYEEALSLGRGDKVAGRVLEALQRLRKVSLHPNLADDDDNSFLANSARMRMMVGVLDAIAGLGERALVFVEDLECMARLAGFLQRRYQLKAPPLTINGSVSGSARHARVESFQKSSEVFDVMLMSPKAGGVGLTLTRANHVIHLTRWWNPAVEDQCTARALRIGQTKPVSVHIPLATLPDRRLSFDQKLHALLARKRRLMRDALLPPEVNAKELSDMLDEIVA